MNREFKMEKEFIGYEYSNVLVPQEMESVYTDGYENFGWIYEETTTTPPLSGSVSIKLKRDRKIQNKAELIRLQRQFEACVDEMISLEKSTKSWATIIAFTIGILGCACFAGAVFSYTAGMLPLMIVFAIPGFVGFILPYFCYRSILAKRGAKNATLIDQKQDEIYDVCKKANHLLT